MTKNVGSASDGKKEAKQRKVKCHRQRRRERRRRKTTTNGTTIEENDEATNTKATKKIINPGRYPGEYCQYCGEHEHMVHVKYASQVLGEGKLVCYGCLAEEKKELERKQKVMTNAKKREKNRQAKMKMKAAMLSTPTTTVTSMSNLPSLPLSSPRR